jgi:hypothetical protein
LTRLPSLWQQNAAACFASAPEPWAFSRAGARRRTFDDTLARGPTIAYDGRAWVDDAQVDSRSHG